MDHEDQSWIDTATEVAVLQHLPGSSERVTVARVERVTSTQIVLDNGGRYRRKDLREVGKSNPGYGPWAELRPVNAPEVRRLRARQRLRRLAHIIAEYERSIPRTAEVSGVVTALATIERKVAATREAVAELVRED